MVTFPSSFHGRIDEIPGISVDNFERPNEVQARAYFLSHCHTDHTQGLHTWPLLEQLKISEASIYMSVTTAAVIEDDKISEELMKYVKPLPLGRTLITLPSVPERGLDELLLYVTLIPAGHSLGSVMYLFEINTKTVLFTGDFRMSSNDISKHKYLHKNGDPINLDALYVDTTFINEDYQDFPKRSTSVEYVVVEIKKWLSQGDKYKVALHTSAKYGYEYVYNEIYEKLGFKVYANAKRWTFYSKQQETIPSITNNIDSTRIHICQNRGEKMSHHSCLPEDSQANYLYIHFSAMIWSNYELDNWTYQKPTATRINVCFPTHCSRNEILCFVNYFMPDKVVGFPNAYPYTPRKVLPVESKYTPKKRKIASPNCDRVRADRKVDKDVLRSIFDL